MKCLLGVCGSIAAYKAAELVRLFQEQRVDVHVALTAGAERFITALTFNALTGNPVYTSLWSPDQGDDPCSPIEHIAVAQSIDAVLIAPASANTLARLAHGMADDFLTCVALATPAPLLLAPAMNVGMWQHPATQANLAMLQQRGAHVIAPEAGYLACGQVGSGRLADLATIVETTLRTLRPAQDMAAETVLVTAGGTREAIDPVRFLGNRSSGRMGYALAAAARDRGARVILITAASALPPEPGCEMVRVNTATEMAAAIEPHLSRSTMIFGAAAVADFRPRHSSLQKLRRDGPLTLDLEPTPDLMAAAAARRSPGTLVVAFAAELDHLEQSARLKLVRKGVDAVVANNVALPGVGFDAEQNEGLFLTAGMCVPLARSSKRDMADRILDETLKLRAPERICKSDGRDLREAAQEAASGLNIG